MSDCIVVRRLDLRPVVGGQCVEWLVGENVVWWCRENSEVGNCIVVYRNKKLGRRLACSAERQGCVREERRRACVDRSLVLVAGQVLPARGGES